MGGPAVLWAALQDGARKMTPPPLGAWPTLYPWNQVWCCLFKNTSGMRTHHVSRLPSFLCTDSRSPSLS